MPRPKAPPAPETTEGGARRRPGGVGWSGPSQDRAQIAERGAKKVGLYLDPDQVVQLERVRIALGLPEERFVGKVWAAAMKALEKELEAKKG